MREGTADAVAARFWAKVEKTPTCWLWTGATTDSGYGRISIDRSNRRAHRIGWKLQTGNGAPPFLCHKCNVRRCVRVDAEHVYDGSARENTRDQIEAGTFRRANAVGEQYRHAKLTNAAVVEIRARFAAGESQRALAAAFHVVPATIHRVVHDRGWRHVTATSRECA